MLSHGQTVSVVEMRGPDTATGREQLSALRGNIQLGRAAVHRGAPPTSASIDARASEYYTSPEAAAENKEAFMNTSPYGETVEFVCGHLGIPQGLLLQLFYKESAFRPHVKNPNSSAYGLGQIIDGTWE